MTRKSQVVFDEIGYNVSQEVKNLINSLDDGNAFGAADEALETRVSELESKLAEVKAHNAELREVIVAKLEKEVAMLRTKNDELTKALAKVEAKDTEDDGR